MADDCPPHFPATPPGLRLETWAIVDHLLTLDLGRTAIGLRNQAKSIARATAALTPNSDQWARFVARKKEVSETASAPVSRRAIEDTLGVRAQFEERLMGDMRDYSREEVRRYLCESERAFAVSSLQEVDRMLRGSKIIRERPVDAFGVEPRFLFAAHLAYAMLAADPGANASEVFAAFMEREGRVAWPTCTFDEVDRLTRIYPFIPKWRDDVKSTRDLALASVPDGLSQRTTQDANFLLERIHALAMLPMVHPILKWASEARGERGTLAGTRLFDVSHVMADKIPHYASLIGSGGLRGRDITVFAKHYAADKIAIDVAQRVFGVTVNLLPASADADKRVEEQVKAAILQALDAPDQRPLLLHVGGVRIWEWLEEQLQKRESPIEIAAVSHTTSDGRELLGMNRPLRFPCELMSMSSAKITDERDRFRHSLMHLMARLEDSLDQHIRSRRFIIKGFGNIMGRAMAEALSAMKLDFAVMDPRPEARAEARAAGYDVVTSLDRDKDRRLVILGCATGPAVTMEEISLLEKPAIFLQVQSGRAAFPMDNVEAAAKAENGAVARRVVSHLGYLPIYEYEVTSQGKTVPHTFVADGYVANLAFARPNNTETSIITNLIIEESLRQCAFRLERLRGGDLTMRGAHVLRAIDVELTPDKSRRVVSLYPRDQETAPTPLAEVLISDEALSTAFAGPWADEALLIRGATSVIKPLSTT